MRLLPCAAPLLGLALLSPAMADTPASGFSLTQLPYPTGTATATLSDGTIVASGGASIDLYDANGTLLLNLASLPMPVFVAVFEIDPTETFLLFGESSNGDLFRVALDGSGMTYLTTLPFNFDAGFEGAGSAVVSAATCGFFCGNEIYRLDTTTGATTQLAAVSGPSGPVAVDAAGLVFYATQSGQFPPPPGFTDVVFFTPAQLQGGAVLGDADAFLFSGGFNGGSDLEFDPASGALYLAENDFATGVNRVLQVGPSAASSTEVVVGTRGRTIGSLELAPGAGPATFQAFQPAAGGTLRYNTTDFAGFNGRFALQPARPQAGLSGPGVAGAGSVELLVTGALPGGTLLVLFGPQSAFNPVEATYSFASVAAPVHSGLDLGSLQFVPFFLPVDGTGEGRFLFFNPGSLQGQFAFQGLVGDSSATSLGTSTSVLL